MLLPIPTIPISILFDAIDSGEIDPSVRIPNIEDFVLPLWYDNVHISFLIEEPDVPFSQWPVMERHPSRPMVVPMPFVRVDPHTYKEELIPNAIQGFGSSPKVVFPPDDPLTSVDIRRSSFHSVF